jgi:alpha-L-fucosidase
MPEMNTSTSIPMKTPITRRSFVKASTLAAGAGLVLLTLSAPGQTRPATGTAEPKDARLAAWREARFGLFIHWGLYSILGRGEWVQWNEQIPVDEYAKLAAQFHPANFDANAWVAVAKSAGMKYMVLTTRHHDGFALFDDPGNDFTSVQTAARRDFVADYVKAARNGGMLVGLYYSPLDWRFPGFFFPDLQLQNAETMRDQYHRQMRELLSNYGKIDILFFDGGEQNWLGFGGQWGPAAQWQKRPAGQTYQGRFNWQSDQVYAMLRKLQPDVVINGRADMPEDFHSREGDSALGNFDADHPWELCTTLAGGAWGWKTNAAIKPLRDCILLLVKAAGRDGNFILNVGPRPDGLIDPPQAQRLKEIGDWLVKFGNSIYGTRGGPFLPGAYGVSTYRDKRVYVHVLNWPEGGKLALPALPAKIIGASLLGGGAVSFSQSEQRVEISVPAAGQDSLDTIAVLELEQPANGLKPIPVGP